MKVFMDGIDKYPLTSFLKQSIIHNYNLEIYRSTNDAFSDEAEAEMAQITNSQYLQHFIKQQTR